MQYLKGGTQKLIEGLSGIRFEKDSKPLLQCDTYKVFYVNAYKYQDLKTL